MKNIDELIKKAKPAVPELPNDFSKNILSKINALGLEIAPRKSSGTLGSWSKLIIGCLLLVLGLIVTNNAIFQMQMSGSLELLSFGSQYTVDVAGYLPLDMILPILLITAMSSWLLWRSHLLKPGIALTAAVCFLITSIGGTALAATDINTQIQSSVIKEKTNIPIISWFYKERAKYHLKHPQFQMGEVLERQKEFVLIKDPYGKTQKIYLPSNMAVTKGQYIRLNGEQSGDGFHAANMQHCNPKRVGKYFSHMNMMGGKMGPGMMMNNGMMKHHRMMQGNDK
jgi:hypothetical protein